MLRRLAVLLTFAIAVGAADAAHATTITLNYTDAFSNTAALVLTATPVGPSEFDVTNVTGTWAGNVVTAGPVSNSFFSSTSNKFYTDPSVLPSFTLDTGFVFTTAVSVVQFYSYNYGSVGYASSIVDPQGGNYHSGAASLGDVSVSNDETVTTVPEPATLLLTTTALSAGFIRRRRLAASLRSA